MGNLYHIKIVDFNLFIKSYFVACFAYHVALDKSKPLC